MSKTVKNHSAMKTDESEKALKILMETGMDQSTAIRWAMKFTANVLEAAWLAGHEDRGTVPQMRVQYKVKERGADV
ncbi:hypothetical protein [Streptomyces althioticus]|uniref:hypothetical protein n=1 Tax=Streptomyces althioticus TaxID=83380 RepID=UPI0033EC53C0